jgi:hypothetical protein
MKKINWASIALVMILALVSCSEDEAKDLKEQLLPTKMTATINDTAWKAEIRKTYKYTTTNSFFITGTSVDGKIINITTFGTSEGDYNLNTSVLDTSSSASVKFSAVFKRSATASPSDIYYAKKGTVTISEVNTSEETISGTFSFTMFRTNNDDTFNFSDTISVSDGKFQELNITEK